MTLQEGLDYCNIVLAKDQNGNVLSPSQYNTLLKAVNDELFEDRYLDFVKNKTLPVDVQMRMLDASPIKRFITNYSYTNPSPTTTRPYLVVTMPDDARYPAAVIATVDSIMRNVDIVDEAAYAMLKTSLLHRDISKNPIGVQRDGEWHIIPSSVTTVEVAYFRNPLVPYYDTAVDSNDNTVYLPVGYWLVATATPYYFDVYYNNGIADVLVYSNVYYEASATVGTKIDSSTTELEWDRYMHMEFFNKILERMGVNIRDEQIGKFTQNKDVKARIN